MIRDPERARSAHLLRRTGLAVDASLIDRFAQLDWDEGVAEILAEADAVSVGEPPRSDDWGDVVSWWLDRMAEPAGGLRERMTWFWHTVLTTNAWMVSDVDLLGEQLAGLRAGCLGNYRDLLQGYVTGGALLDYLDASGSIAMNPNENLARELMELFTVGPGHYTQDDVRAGARALAGWVVEDGRVEWRRDHAFVAPLVFRGVQADWTTESIVDHLCDEPETAISVAAKLWTHLVGTALDGDAVDDLGRWWHGRDLEIGELVERILGDPAAVDARYSRARTGLEWYIAFVSATGSSPEGPWALETLGQMPYLPPNVGGWPMGDRWLEAGSLLGRASLAFNADYDRPGPTAVTEPDAILDACGLHDVAEATLDALAGVTVGDDLDADSVRRTRWRLALSSPEFNLA